MIGVELNGSEADHLMILLSLHFLFPLSQIFIALQKLRSVFLAIVFFFGNVFLQTFVVDKMATGQSP
jgi:hypothetical protein